MKKAIVVLVVLGVAGATFYYLRNSGKDTAGKIIVSGNIELTEVNIGFKTPGRLIALNVREGDSVKQGAVIARLDRDQLTAQRDREAAALASAQSQVAQSGTQIEWQRATTAGDIEQKLGDLVAAEAKLAEMRNGARPQEKLDAQATVEAAAAEVERTSRDWDRAQVLHKNDDISTSQFDQYRRNFDTATANLKSAKEKQALVVAGPRVEQINAQQAQVERSRGALKVAEANNFEIQRRQEEMGGRRAETNRSKANLALINTQLEDTVAASPVDGVVLTKSADPGEVLSTGATVVTVGDIDHPWLRGYINETDLAKVKIGSKVRVTTDSYPGKVYNGHVSFVASEAEFTPKQIQTKQERVKLVYRIKIDLENPNRELKSNMPADAEIVLD